MRVARGLRADGAVGLLAAEPVRVFRIGRVLTLVVGVRPLGFVGLVGRVVQRVMGVGIAGAVARILAGRLGKAACGGALFGGVRLVHVSFFAGHVWRLPARGGR